MAVAFGSATSVVGNNVTTSSINVPASTADGDMLLLIIGVSESVGVTPTVSGTWTQKVRVDQVASFVDNQDNTLILYWRRASSEPGSYTITWDGTYGNYGAAAMIRYTGVVASGDPFRTTNTASGGTTPGAGPKTSAALTGVLTGDMALHFTGAAKSAWANANTYDLAGPGGSWVERGEIKMQTTNTGQPGILALEQLSTGTAPAFTATGTASGNVVWLFIGGALIPAAITSPAVFTATGSWQAPAGVTTVKVECWAGGGSGGSARSASGKAGGGGAGGCYVIRGAYPVTPGNTYTVTVGAGGAPSTGAAFTDLSIGNNGADTWFDSTSGVVAKGGAAGQNVVTTANGAAGAGSTTGCIADTAYAGGNGAAGVGTTIGGGGGGGAGSTDVGGNAAGSVAGTGTSLSGGAGSSGTTAADAAFAQSNGGAGGGAQTDSSTTRVGGNGAQGQVTLTWPTVSLADSRKIYGTAVRRASTW